MSKYEKRKQKRNRKSFFERLIVITFMMIVTYLSYSFYISYQSSNTIETFAQVGTMEKIVAGRAKIIRDEQILYAPASGDIEYYYLEGEKVKNSSRVIKIYKKDLSVDIEKKLEEIDLNILKKQEKRGDVLYYNDEIRDIDAYIYELVNEYMKYKNTDYVFDIYTLKRELLSKILQKRELLASEETSYTKQDTVTRNDYNNMLASNVNYITAPAGGVISYYVDGYEEYFTVSKIKILNEKYLQVEPSKYIITSKKNYVKEKEAIAKIVSTGTWYITAVLDQKQTEEWQAGQAKNIRVKNVNDGNIKGTIYHILEDKNKNIVTFVVSQQLNKYMSFRDIEIEVIESKVEGIKIPKEAIIKKDLLIVPNEFVSINQGKEYVIRLEEGQKKAVGVSLHSSDETYAYIEESVKGVKRGDVLVSSKDNKETTLSATKEISGVNILVGDIVMFKNINIIGSNQEVCIVDQNAPNSVNVYDKIIIES